ncbi:MAG: AMP-binding protein [Steroidobacteraceae bacterium]
MDRIWLKHYPPGVPSEIRVDPEASLASLVLESCRRYGERPAFRNWGTTLTYGELERRSQCFAAYLLSVGMKKGDRIALMMPNLLQYPITLFGALRAGLVVVNTNPLYTARELEHQLHDSGARCIVVLANFAHVLQQVLPRTQIELVILTELGDALRFPKGRVISWAARRVKKMVPKFRIEHALKLNDALDRGSRLPFSAPALTGTDLAFLQYTGGTTGIAKGAMLTHSNMVANLQQVAAMWTSIIEDGKDVMVTPLPLYHVFCLTCNCLTFMHHGCLNVLITNPRDLPAFVTELKRQRFSFITGVNTLYKALMDQPGFEQINFSAFKLAVAGGMALHPSVMDRWQTLSGKPLVEGYGLTEASPVIACNVPGAQRAGTVGLPVPSTDLSIRDDGDRELGCDQPGELCVRGPQIMRGYWNRPEETAKTVDADGWLHTGDIAFIDPDGFVRIVDRKKDMIIVSGFKVYPNEIETVIASHPAVIEAGCIGVPDPDTGQAVKVFVVLRPGATVSVPELVEFCREQLTGYKVPKHIVFCGSLPKTNVGKVLRRELQQLERSQVHA